MVSEAADPDRDERNNSSRAGSTPIQNKSLRRVTFAVEDISTQQSSQAKASDTDTQAPGISAVASSSNANALKMQSLPAQPALRPSQLQCDRLGQSGDEPDAAASACNEDNSDADDNASSVGSLSASAGSTPYINKSQLSAALQQACAESDSAGNAWDSEEPFSDISTSNMMERLLTAELTELDLADSPDLDNEVAAIFNLMQIAVACKSKLMPIF